MTQKSSERERVLKLPYWANAEIAIYYRVTRHVVGNWISRHPDFPEPVAHLAMAKIYAPADIMRWGERNNKKPGRCTE